MSLLLEHPVRVYMLVQPERTVRISRGRRDERERGSERRVREDRGMREVAKYPTRARKREGAKEAPRGMTKRKGAWDSGCTEKSGDIETR